MNRRIKEERFINQLIRSPFSYVVLIFLIALFSYSAVGTYKKSRLAKTKTEQVEAELQRLQKQEEGLRSSLEDMNTDYGLEKALREKFGIVREGETSIIIIEPEEDSVPDETDENKGIFHFLREIF